MAGTGWESADLLARFQLYAGLSANPSITPTQQYQCLADGQNEVLVEIANVVPRVLYGAPTAMTTSDGGYTWQFGTDGNGYALFPLGKASIYPNLDAVPDYPWQPGLDYLDEGTQIRIPNNISWPGPLYWYGMTPPAAISATVQPVIQPPTSRILIVLKAVRIYAEQFAKNAELAADMDARWEKTWPKQAAMLRRHFRGSSRLGPLTGAWGRGGSTFGFGIGSGFGF